MGVLLLLFDREQGSYREMSNRVTTSEYREMLHDIMIDGHKDEWTAAELATPLSERATRTGKITSGRYYGLIDWGQRVAQVLRKDPFVQREKKLVNCNSPYYSGKKRVYVYSIDRNNIEWWIKKGLGKKIVYYCGCRLVFSTKNPDRWKLINYDLCPIHTR